MLVTIINSGSDGNCTIIKDIEGNELMMDCGIDYEKIITNINFPKLNAICLSHYH